jgi:hypothetical protein
MKKSFLPCRYFYSSNSGNTFLTMMPQWTSDNKVPLSEFSTERALGKVKAIEANHYVCLNHDQVAAYPPKKSYKS